LVWPKVAIASAAYASLTDADCHYSRCARQL